MLRIFHVSTFLPPSFICKCSTLHCRRFAPTLFSRRENNRADDIRPYADGATESAGQKFRCAVGADSIRPPTWQVFGQNRYAPTLAPMLRIFHVSTFLPPNFICKCSTLHCRRFAPTLFSRRENNRADDIRPYMAYATKYPLGIQWNRPCRVVPPSHRADIS